MAYATLSQWSTTDWNDELEAVARDKFVPLILSMGADRVTMIRTGDRSFTVITEYSDAAAAEAAQEKIAAARAQAAQELPISMDSSDAGEVFASG